MPTLVGAVTEHQVAVADGWLRGALLYAPSARVVCHLLQDSPLQLLAARVLPTLLDTLSSVKLRTAGDLAALRDALTATPPLCTPTTAAAVLQNPDAATDDLAEVELLMCVACCLWLWSVCCCALGFARISPFFVL